MDWHTKKLKNRRSQRKQNDRAKRKAITSEKYSEWMKQRGWNSRTFEENNSSNRKRLSQNRGHHDDPKSHLRTFDDSEVGNNISTKKNTSSYSEKTPTEDDWERLTRATGDAEGYYRNEVEREWQREDEAIDDNSNFQSIENLVDCMCSIPLTTLLGITEEECEGLDFSELQLLSPKKKETETKDLYDKHTPQTDFIESVDEIRKVNENESIDKIRKVSENESTVEIRKVSENISNVSERDKSINSDFDHPNPTIHNEKFVIFDDKNKRDEKDVCQTTVISDDDELDALLAMPI